MASVCRRKAPGASCAAAPSLDDGPRGELAPDLCIVCQGPARPEEPLQPYPCYNVHPGAEIHLACYVEFLFKNDGLKNRRFDDHDFLRGTTSCMICRKEAHVRLERAPKSTLTALGEAVILGNTLNFMREGSLERCFVIALLLLLSPFALCFVFPATLLKLRVFLDDRFPKYGDDLLGIFATMLCEVYAAMALHRFYEMVRDQVRGKHWLLSAPEFAALLKILVCAPVMLMAVVDFRKLELFDRKCMPYACVTAAFDASVVAVYIALLRVLVSIDVRGSIDRGVLMVADWLGMPIGDRLERLRN